ncbi:MAG: pyridoxal-phosphate dependent enzyme [Phycisphaerales bacterium]|nr:pyridoxal-phosphate dependent enzyme [Phycisphaerales bacterium]
MSSKTQRAPVFGDVLEMIGNTPMLEFRRLDTGPCRLFGKLEYTNPGGSVKDRMGWRMIEQAEQDGRLKPGGLIIEATAGNTGIALALVGCLRGYRVKVVMPDKMSQEKIDHLKALGAQVVLTRSDVAKGHPDYYQDLAQRIADEESGFYVNQFGNPANAQAHYETTGPEIWEQLEGDIDAVVFGVGSGGTLSGTGKYLKEKNPKIDIVLADPKGSVLAPLVKTGKMIEPGSWLVEGIGEDFVPSILDLDLVTDAYEVTDAEAFHAARHLLRTEGVFAGSSSGTLLAGALKYCRAQQSAKRVCVLVCDTGNKYLNKMFSDSWMIENGFIRREEFGDLRDLIQRRHLDQEDFTVSPTDTLAVAHGRMKLYGISQVPVIRDRQIVGIIDESDLLLAVNTDPANFKRSVGDFMVTRLETLPPRADIRSLVPIFRASKVALIADAEQYYGLITQIDLLNYLRRQALQS